MIGTKTDSKEQLNYDISCVVRKQNSGIKDVMGDRWTNLWFGIGPYLLYLSTRAAIAGRVLTMTSDTCHALLKSFGKLDLV